MRAEQAHLENVYLRLRKTAEECNSLVRFLPGEVTTDHRFVARYLFPLSTTCDVLQLFSPRGIRIFQGSLRLETFLRTWRNMKLGYFYGVISYILEVNFKSPLEDRL